MIGYYLSNNNETCYSNFSPTGDGDVVNHIRCRFLVPEEHRQDGTVPWEQRGRMASLKDA